MSKGIQNLLDFQRFVFTLVVLPSCDMLSAVEDEIKDVSNSSADDAMEKFRQIYYRNKLERLRTFLLRHDLPMEMPPQEQEAYQALVNKFEADGLQIRKLASGSKHVTIDANIATWLIMATSV